MAVTERVQLGSSVRRNLSLSSRWWLAPILVYLGSRVVAAVLIVITSAIQVERTPEVGFVWRPAGPDPGYLTVLGNWDGQWYGEIASNGYPSELPRVDGEIVPNSWAFYPLFPYLMRLVMAVSHLPFELAATLVTMTAGAAAMLLLYRLVEPVGGRFNALTTVTALSFFPAAPILQAAYADSLTLLLVVVCLTLLRDGRFPLLILATLLLSFSRPIVLPLALVIGLHALIRWRRRDVEPFPTRQRAWYVAAAAFAVASFAIWPLIAALVTGEPNAYFATQRAWIYDGSEGWPSWVVSVTVPGARARGLFAMLMLAFAFYAVLRRAGRSWGTEVRLWSFGYLAFLAASTRPTSSIVRYAMIALVPAWPGFGGPGSEPSPRRRFVTMATIVVIGTALQWVWLRLFFIPSYSSHGFA